VVAQPNLNVPNNREVVGTFSLMETWRMLAAARGTSLEVNHLIRPCPGSATDTPCRTERGWMLSHSDGTGVQVQGPRPVVVDLYLPQGRELETEMLRRQGPWTALVMSVTGFTPIHAAGIQTPRGFLALAAPSGAGKSTVASLAHANGWAIAGDDVLAMDDDLTILPLPGSLRTDAPWMDVANPLSADGRRVRSLAPLPAKQKLTALVTLVRGSDPLLAPVTGADRLAILADAMLAGFLSDRDEQMLDFAAGIPVHRLTVPSDLAALRTSWPAVRNMLEAACG
jgi:hypothetical protein